MKEIIKNAFSQVVSDTLRSSATEAASPLIHGYLSDISITFSDGVRQTFSFVAEPAFLNAIGEALFGSSECDELELIDLSQELANLTIGLAKVIAVGCDMHFNISTPTTHGLGSINAASMQSVDFCINGAHCSVFF